MVTAALAEVVILRVSGARETHTVGRHILMDWIQRMIDATTLDTVNLRDGRVMLIDDNGYETETIEHPSAAGVLHLEVRAMRALKPVNSYATALYHAVCRPGTLHAIVGDVAIARDEDFLVAHAKSLHERFPDAFLQWQKDGR